MFLHIGLVSIYFSFFSSSPHSPLSSCNHARTLRSALITKEGWCNLKSITNDADIPWRRDPDTLDRLVFLCIAEREEAMHYEVLDELAEEVKIRNLLLKLSPS